MAAYTSPTLVIRKPMYDLCQDVIARRVSCDDALTRLRIAYRHEVNEACREVICDTAAFVKARQAGEKDL